MKWTAFFGLLWMSSAFGQPSVNYVEVPFLSSRPAEPIQLPDATIPLDIAQQLPFVIASVDKKPGKFLLDTGAPLLVLNQPADGKQPTIAATSIAATFEISHTKVNDFHWENIQYKNLDALQLDIRHLEHSTNRTIKGIIGYDIVKGFEVFINYPDKQLLLLKPEKNKLHIAAEPLLTLDFELQDHLPVIEVEIENQIFRLGLDTGAGTNVLDERHNQTLELFATTEEFVKAIDQRSNVLQSIVIETTELGNLKLNAMPYVYANLSHLAANTTLRIDGLLGYPFFAQVKCSIDYPNRKLHIWAVEE